MTSVEPVAEEEPVASLGPPPVDSLPVMPPITIFPLLSSMMRETSLSVLALFPVALLPVPDVLPVALLPVALLPVALLPVALLPVAPPVAPLPVAPPVP